MSCQRGPNQIPELPEGTSPAATLTLDLCPPGWGKNRSQSFEAAQGGVFVAAPETATLGVEIQHSLRPLWFWGFAGPQARRWGLR